MDTSGSVINTVLRAIALATGVAVVVLTALNVASPRDNALALGIGLAALAVSALDRPKS